MIDDSIKCMGVWHEHRLYYNGKHNDFLFLLLISKLQDIQEEFAMN